MGNEQQISVLPITLNLLQKWSRIFQSDRIETNFRTKIPGIFWVMKSIRSFVLVKEIAFLSGKSREIVREFWKEMSTAPCNTCKPACELSQPLDSPGMGCGDSLPWLSVLTQITLSISLLKKRRVFANVKVRPGFRWGKRPLIGERICYNTDWSTDGNSLSKCHASELFL